MQDHITRLKEILDHIDEKHLDHTDPRRLVELGFLYREAIADLNRARSSGDELQEKSLNDLVMQAYSLIYRRPQNAGFYEILTFVYINFPKLVLKRLHYVITAFLIFLCSSIVGFLCVSNDSKLIDLLIPQKMRLVISRDLEQGKIGRDITKESKAALSSFIFTNNVTVTFKSFAYGIFFGIGTFYILVYNGLQLGGLAAVYHNAGHALEFWSLILPHGTIEFVCCFIGGAAGLVLGYALINPFRCSRYDHLKNEGKEALYLVLGTIPLLCAAAVIEAFITPLHIPIVGKYAFAAVVFLFVILYFIRPVFLKDDF